MRVMALIGAIWVVLSLAGAFFPGLSFHVYFGTTEGAQKWHIERAQAKEETS